MTRSGGALTMCWSASSAVVVLVMTWPRSVSARIRAWRIGGSSSTSRSCATSLTVVGELERCVAFLGVGLRAEGASPTACRYLYRRLTPWPPAWHGELEVSRRRGGVGAGRGDRDCRKHRSRQ